MIVSFLTAGFILLGSGSALAAKTYDFTDESDEFQILDQGEAPQAVNEAVDPSELDLGGEFSEDVDDIEVIPVAGKAVPGRMPKAAKKKDSTDRPAIEDMEEGEEPVEEFDMEEEEPEDGLGIDVQGLEEAPEGKTPTRSSHGESSLDPLEDLDDGPLGDLSEEKPPAPPTPAATGSTKAAPVPSAISLDVVGKQPLADNYPASIVATDRDSVVVEMPVLIGRSRADFQGTAYWVVAEVLVDGKKVSETRNQVTSPGMAEFGPTFMWVKMLAPVPAQRGTLEIRVSRADSTGGTTKPLFSRQVAYTLQ